MPTYKLTAIQKISITADINATSREQAIERFADFLHGWVNRANEERTAAGKQPRDAAFSLIDIDENEGGWTIFDQADSGGEPLVKGA